MPEWTSRPARRRLSDVNTALRQAGAMAALLMLLGQTAASAGGAPVEWGSPVVLGGGWGRLVSLDGEEWLAVTARYPAGTNSHLRLHRSTDGARSWSDLAEVREPGRTLDNGELGVLPDGTVLLTMRSLIPGQSYRLPVYASTDGGRSWVRRADIDASEGLGERGLWEPDFQVLADGRVTVTYSNEKHATHSQLISQRTSADGGRTWGAETWAVAEPGGGRLRPGMSQMTRLADGRYLLVYEVVGIGNADVHAKTSADGVEWPAGLGRRVPGHHAGPFVTTLPNGLVLVTSCANRLSASEDHGGTWVRWEPVPWNLGQVFTWPALYPLGSNRVAAVVVNQGVRLRPGVIAPRRAWPDPWRESFEGADEAGWVTLGGRATRADGRYTLASQGTNALALAGDAFWADGVLETDLRLLTPGNAGLVFRTTDAGESGPDDFRGYYAGLDTAGAVLLGRMDGSWTLLRQAAFAVATNRWHRLRVVLAGRNLDVFVDGQEQAVVSVSVPDEPGAGRPVRGQVGVRTFRGEAWFDNLSWSNRLPARVEIRRSAGGLELAWPEVPSTVGPVAAPAPASGEAGGMVGAAVREEGGWRLTLPAVASEPAAFYWLHAR